MPSVLSLSRGNTYVDENGVNRTINSTAVNASSLGSNTCVAARGAGIKIRVIGFVLTSTLAQTVTFLSNAVAISAAFPVAASGGFVVPQTDCLYFETAANEALNINLSAATATGITILWVEAV